MGLWLCPPASCRQGASGAYQTSAQAAGGDTAEQKPIAWPRFTRLSNDRMPKPKPCIFVVDDDVQGLRLVRRILEMNGYQVITASSGKSALVAFDQQPLDLVVLDITLPGIDGYAVCQHIRTFSNAHNNADGADER